MTQIQIKCSTISSLVFFRQHHVDPTLFCRCCSICQKTKCARRVLWCVCRHMYVHVAMRSASMAACISQSRNRTCCLSGCRVAIVTPSASLRCFWETISHPAAPVWASATGHRKLSVYFFSSLLLNFIFSLNSVRGRRWRGTTVSFRNSFQHTHSARDLSLVSTDCSCVAPHIPVSCKKTILTATSAVGNVLFHRMN